MHTPLAERKNVFRDAGSDYPTIPIKRPNPLSDPMRWGRLWDKGRGERGVLIVFQD